MSSSSVSSTRFRVSTTIKNFVLCKEPWASKIREYGFDRYTDPEIIAEGLLAMDSTAFKGLVDDALKFKKDQREQAKEIFGV